MLAMSTLMMPAPTMALGAPQLAVGPHKPHETKLLAIHPAHSQPQTTPQQGNINMIRVHLLILIIVIKKIVRIYRT